MTVAPSVLIAFGVGVFFTLVCPLLLLVFLGIRKRISPVPVVVGALTFFISQMVLRIPILNALSGQQWFQSFAASQLIAYLLILSFTAGLFEESARLVGVRFFCRKHRAYTDAISFGLGHGFCEAILLVGFTHLNSLIYAVMMNTGSFSILAEASPQAAEQITAALTSAQASTIYLAILERVFAVLFHLFATMLIFQGVNRRRSFPYYILAILAHTIFNFVSVLLMQYAGIWASELFLCFGGIFSLIYLLRARRDFPANSFHLS
ncbi:YhfC family glutamic-type intramembrane protease [Clostridium sp. D33t1_170424_F3]|uniref:YhfC family intramembrane metalloprotease n=1 Tax=Clostridium sp. D33t1_170424_F3 TaxID=2787099 RepID=UPI0018A9DFAB|nr:YhfC family glutamic-type intramembrane protease [Clostridium sp. D33t1_170424_F3]